MRKSRMPWRSIASLTLLALVAACSQAPQPPPAPGLAGSSFMVLRNDISGYIQIPHAAALNPANALTIEGWIRFDQLAGECVSLVGKDYLVSYWVGSCEGLLASIVGGEETYFEGGAFTAGVWTHFAVTSDATSRRHYLDGALVSTAAAPHSAGSGNAELRIGSDVEWNYPPSASIDEVRLWNRALSQGEIQSLMGTTLTQPQTGLVAVWALDRDGRDTLRRHHGSRADSPAFGLDGVISPADSSMPVVSIITPNCAALGATSVHYEVIPVHVEDAGTYRVTVSSSNSFASFYVYQGSFDPENATANCVAASNSPVNGRKSVEVALTADGPHHVVVFNDHFDQTVTVDYTVSLALP